MKIFKCLIVSIISIFAFCITVNAASAILTVSTGSVYIGDSFTITANVFGVAAWNVHSSASGPVSGCIINQADATADAMDTNRSFSATCTATAEGTIAIILNGDVTSASDGIAVPVYQEVYVNAVQRPAPTPTPTPTPDVPSPNDNRSTNNKLKSISIEGYELIKIDDTHYTLEVSNDVTSIKVAAVQEDSKAKVEGTGNHDIKVGENNIEVVVIAENGSKRKISINVTRKDGYYLEDLDSQLDSSDDINIIIEFDASITTNELEKIKTTQKVVKFNYYNSSQVLLYSWILDGSKISESEELITTIETELNNKEEILKSSNYSDGLMLRLGQKNNLNAKIKYYVGDKYEDGTLLNVYSYTDDFQLVNKEVKVENSYIEFDTKEATDYLITRSLLANNKGILISKYVLYILIGIIVLLVIIIVVLLITRNKKEKVIPESIIPDKTSLGEINKIETLDEENPVYIFENDQEENISTNNQNNMFNS